MTERVDDDNPGAATRRRYDNEEFIDAVKMTEPASTREIAEVVDCPLRTAHYRLSKLRDEGAIKSKKIGPSVVWFVFEE